MGKDPKGEREWAVTIEVSKLWRTCYTTCSQAQEHDLITMHEAIDKPKRFNLNLNHRRFLVVQVKLKQDAQYLRSYAQDLDVWTTALKRKPVTPRPMSKLVFRFFPRGMHSMTSYWMNEITRTMAELLHSNPGPI